MTQAKNTQLFTFLLLSAFSAPGILLASLFILDILNSIGILLFSNNCKIYPILLPITQLHLKVIELAMSSADSGQHQLVATLNPKPLATVDKGEKKLPNWSAEDVSPLINIEIGIFPPDCTDFLWS